MRLDFRGHWRAKFGLADAGIARDQRQSGEPTGALADLLRAARKGLKCGFLRHAQIKADPMGERTEIDRHGHGFAVLAATATACPVCPVHRDSHFKARTDRMAISVT